MPTPELTIGTETRLRLLFPPAEQEHVRALLREECGNNLPFLQNFTDAELDRFRYAALKLSNGDLKALQLAIRLAKKDWRDLLVAAGFASRLEAHHEWLPTQLW